MTADETRVAFGWRVHGLGVMALAIVCLAWGDFDPGQPVPKDFPDRTALAYAAAVFTLVAGAAVEWRRAAAWGAAALTVYYALVVVIVMNGRVMLALYAEFLQLQRRSRTVRDRSGRADRLRCQRQHQSDPGRAQH